MKLKRWVALRAGEELDEHCFVDTRGDAQEYAENMLPTLCVGVRYYILEIKDVMLVPPNVVLEQLDDSEDPEKTEN